MGKDNFKWMDQQPLLLGLQERIMQRVLYIETVADPHLQIKGGGGTVIQTLR